MLAHNLQNDFCANLTYYIKSVLSSKSFIEEFKTIPSAFTRQRKLSFADLLLFLARPRQQSMASELRVFIDQCRDSDRNFPDLDDSSIFKARSKVHYSAFSELNQRCINFAKNHSQLKLWNGLQLMCVDGSTLRLPDTGDISDFFKPQSDANGSFSGPPLARFMALYDPLNEICLSADIDNTSLSEIKSLPSLSWNWGANQLLLADRHYDAFWLFSWLSERHVDFCIRLKLDQRSIIMDFLNSGLTERVVEFHPGRSARSRCRQHGVSEAPRSLRLIRVQLPDGSIEVLATSLTDNQQFPAHLFKDLYHQRWSIEEKFKQYKCLMQIEHWSGKSAATVFQDFHAKIWASNLVAWIAAAAESIVQKKCANRTLKYKINYAHAISAFKQYAVRLFHSNLNIRISLQRLYKVFADNLSAIRPNRSNPRNHKPYQREFYPAYKSAF